MVIINPKYRYVRVGGTRSQRRPNTVFYAHRQDQKVRVCKVFFRNTLAINDRSIRTVLEKMNKVGNVLLESDLRVKHGKQKAVDPIIKEGIKQHIVSILKIERHYLRANTSRHFIEGIKSIAYIHKDYVDRYKEKKFYIANHTSFYRVFTQEFNISLYIPKKDLCDTVAVYDLQAVVQLPKGDVSHFYYKSKLNVFNFTVYDFKTNTCECYCRNGHRGVNELGSCVLQYLKKITLKKDADIVFYSDNCAGQQKNKCMLAIYLYAVRYLGIRSICHKYLIKGHTQNEGDSPHS
ncbi:hypothetical protein PR048_022178 [Dryococelus australis]|uniref:DUF7869 domain-containing protein n=1 Tax=Dryococelus australis TaxID=614101 RepID=A0ABQ9H0A8_9NEOP|nr:hypothetical protein PR048_022178 [Dryococelus australis]